MGRKTRYNAEQLNSMFHKFLSSTSTFDPVTLFSLPSVPSFTHTNMESVVLETSLGDIQLELYWDHAPKVS